MDYVYGNYAMWCRRCVIEAQLAYARTRAEVIPELERELHDLQVVDAEKGSAHGI